ncbi:D-alanyl-D-alanine carboxypeptidase/D-alanyl-D-alanine-endopeptidase (penicillin-binding protein 4) [Neisseria perflava]|uniref:D-alanyl-D-alanine carboxypeptidase/D-alanyl-D-alanine endopeptidase n=1 Tax=Neisseria perflava TaxID=33053 RepID=UPI0020A19F42|nr:D-alanyl-D-alanine carboxypeptidase/D-alanyl-D-alanine-endopeptidase [Neisseria perflava]MCP1772782.1 D-alanyl-D-alanine carboxypeptidase/D-alanyl-D-alanine-endopeptidase (penicillin-binding protein 4) [Neisseria perflava]
MKLQATLSALMLCAPLAVSAAALDFGRIPPNEISVYVQELDSGRVVVDHRSMAVVNPASTMKLVTAFTAFQVLGKDYRWPTEWKSNAAIRNGTLEGNIYWVGSGDPVFNQEDLQAMQQGLRDKGIRKISGQLVLDRSLWGDVRNDKEFAADTAEAYMTPPDPNMLAYKVVWLKPQRNAQGEVDIQTKPLLPEIKVDNKVTLTSSAAECTVLSRHMRANYAGGVLHVSGKIPASCLEQEMYVNMLTVKDFAYRSFVNTWRNAGGEISDGLQTAVTPPNAQVLVRHLSPLLQDILTEMNKHSNNLIARSVYLKLGGSPDVQTALQQAEAVVRRELAAAGVDTEGLVLENGAGLSRKERVSAKLLAQMLEKAYFSPFKQEFIHTLPIAGTDGTLKKRLKQAGTPLRLKTGTLKDVRALAGYWLGEKPMIVVAVINSPHSDAYLKDLDRLVSKIVLPGGDSWVDAKSSCDKRLVA